MIPNIIFTCIGTCLTTVIVPIYSGTLAKGDCERAKKFLDDIISISTIFMLALIILGLIMSPSIVWFSGYRNDSFNFNYAVFALRVLIPVMFFYGLNFIFQAILQSHHKFLLPAFVSVPSSLTVILYLLTLSESFGVTGLLFATLLGLSLQALFLLPAVLKLGYRYSPSFNMKSEDVITSFKLSGPVLIGVSAYQINSLFNISLASRFNNVALLQNVQNIVLTSVLTFIYSITSVYYPRLSALWAKENLDEYKKSLSEILSVVLFLLIPLTFGLITLRIPFFNLITNWGKITDNDISIMATILALYSFGIPAMGFKEIIDRALYSQKQTKVSAIVGFIIMALNIIFSLSLAGFLGIYSLPLSYSLSSTIGVSILIFLMYKRIGHFFNGVLSLVWKCLASASIMSITILGIEHIFSSFHNSNIIFRAAALFIPVGFGAIVYFALTYFLNVEQSRIVIEKAKSFLKISTQTNISG